MKNVNIIIEKTRNMKTIVKISGEVELEYDKNSPEFKEALEGYREVIDSRGTADDVLKQVAYYITRFGTEELVEGVGYIGYNGKIPTEEPYSGIMVSLGYDEFEYEID